MLADDNLTIESAFRQGWTFHFSCDNCGRERRLDPVELARRFGWDGSMKRLQLAASCRAYRVRAELRMTHCGALGWVADARADPIIRANPFATGLHGPWKLGRTARPNGPAGA